MSVTDATETDDVEAAAPEGPSGPLSGAKGPSGPLSGVTEQSGPQPVSAPWSPGTDHKVVGTLFVVVGMLFLVAAGVLALVLRTELAGPDVGLVGETAYRQLFTLHGVLGVFGFLAPVWIGLATAIVPLQIGATRLAFPRLQALALWTVVVGGAMVVASPFVDGPEVITGWALSDPIPSATLRGDGPDLFILGLGLVVVALVLAAVNLVVTTLKMRAPGLTLRRTPLFSWSVLVSSSVLLLALPVLAGALLMLFVDRHYNGHIFNGFTGSGGGDPLLWPRLFWFAAYPTLWALLLPGLGVVSEIVPVFARRRMFSHQRATLALGAVGVLAFAGWGTQVPSLNDGAGFLFALGALVVLLPVASVLLNWLATLGTGIRKHPAATSDLATAPMVYAGGFIAVLALGLLGWAVAVVAGTTADRNYWQVASQHTLFFGAATLAVVAALAYWAPKLWGHHLSDKASLPTAFLLAGGMVVSFGAMFVLGFQDMHVHVAGFDADGNLGPANLVATVGGFVAALGVLMFVADLIVNVIAGRGRTAGDDPWAGHTLEWATTSPPPSYNFDRLPEIRSEAPMLDLRAEPGTVSELAGERMATAAVTAGSSR